MAFTGEKGAIKTGENSITKMENWKLSIKANEVDTTSFDSDGWEETEVTTKAWEDTTGQKAVMAALVSGENLPIKLYVDKTAEKEDFSGNIKITGLDIDTTVKDKLKISIKAKGNGKLNGLDD